MFTLPRLRPLPRDLLAHIQAHASEEESREAIFRFLNPATGRYPITQARFVRSGRRLEVVVPDEIFTSLRDAWQSEARRTFGL